MKENSDAFGKSLDFFISADGGPLKGFKSENDRIRLFQRDGSGCWVVNESGGEGERTLRGQP